MTQRRWLLVAVVGFTGAVCSGPRDPPKSTAPLGSARPTRAAAAPPSDSDSLLSRGESTYYRGRIDTARMLFGVALASARAADDPAREARALTWLGIGAWRQGDYAEARNRGEEALALKLRAGLHADLFRSYNALGLLARDEGRLTDALLRYEQADATARSTGDSIGLATVAINMALVHTDLGNFARARAGFILGRDAFHRLGDSMREGRALNNLGMLDAQLGNPRSAITALSAARLLYRATGDRTGEQNALGQLGTAYEALGEPRLALAAFDSALALSRAQGLRQEEASNLELIAGLFRQGGDPQRALELYDQANRIDAELRLVVEQGTNRRNVAEIHALLGRRDLAHESGTLALRLHRETGARLDELRDLLLLADLAADSGGGAVVEEHLRAAERLSAALDVRIARVELALTKATIADRVGNARSVLRILDQARLDLARGGFGGEWQAAELRARAYGRLSRLDSAAVAGREAVAALERVRGNFGSGFLRSSFATDKAAAYGDLVEILLRLGRTAEAFEVADGARNHALMEHLAATTGEAAPTQAAVRALADGEAILRRIDTLVSRLDVLEETPLRQRDAMMRGQIDGSRASLAEARGAYEALLVRAAEQDAAGVALLGGRKITADEVQRVLRTDEVVLQYLVTPARLIVFVVSREEVRSIVTAIERDDLARRVRLARDLLGEPGSPADAPREVLTALHAVLIAPAERAGWLEGAQRVIVVPHSVLAYLPFAALRRAGSGRYLIEDYAVLHVPSAAALGVLRGASRVATSLPEEALPTALAPFPRTLPGSLREARAFRSAVGRVQMQEGSRATEPRLRHALSAGGLVHVATHGVMNPRNPMFSRIELAPGAGSPDDDGRLEVHELLSLRIGAPLVFLSGCETGVGASWSTQFARGEDYATLAQAFLYAGARNVAATLWRIGDDGAAVFAERFYNNLRSMGPVEALVEAQREMMRGKQYSNPYYWAGYQIIGEGTPLLGSHKSPALSVQPE